MTNIVTEEEDRKFIHEANNHLFIIKGTAGILKRKIAKGETPVEDLVERLDKIEAAVDLMTEMFQERRARYGNPDKEKVE